MADLVYGLGTLSVDGEVFGVLQDVEVNFEGESLELRKKPPFTSTCVYTTRSARIIATTAQIDSTKLEKILGGTRNGSELIIRQGDPEQVFELTITAPINGTQMSVFFPSVQSTGNLIMKFAQADYVLLNPEFIANYRESDNVLCVINTA